MVVQVRLCVSPGSVDSAIPGEAVRVAKDGNDYLTKPMSPVITPEPGDATTTVSYGHYAAALVKYLLARPRWVITWP